MYTVHVDRSAADERLGLKRTVYRAGKFKAEGADGGPLTQEASAALQTTVEDIYALFTRAVAKYRGASVDQVRNGYGEARAVTANRALVAGLVDRVASFDDTIRRIAAGVPVVRRSGGTPSASGATARRPLLSRNPHILRSKLDLQLMDDQHVLAPRTRSVPLDLLRRRLELDAIEAGPVIPERKAKPTVADRRRELDRTIASDPALRRQHAEAERMRRRRLGYCA